MRLDAVTTVVPPALLWHRWAFDPAVVVILALAASAYARGRRALAGREHPLPGPRLPGPPILRPRQAVAFYAGLAAVALALASPLDALAGTLLSAHMLQHLILLIAAPALVAYGRPGLVCPLGLPPRRRVRSHRRPRPWHLDALVRLASNPLAVLAVSVVSLWGWHLPVLYDAAAASPPIHAAEHLTFFAVSLAYWCLIVDANPRRRLGYGPGILLTFGVLLQGAALGALIALAPTPLYATYRAGAALWGTTSLADQQLAGALMWIPPGGVYLVTIIVLASRWFADVERTTRRNEALRARSLA